MPNQYSFVKGERFIEVWKTDNKSGTPDAIMGIDLDDEEVQSAIFKQLMRERLMKSESKEGQDIMQCEIAEAVGIIKGMELNGKKIAENDAEAEAILQYLITKQIYEYKSGKAILLEDLTTLRGTIAEGEQLRFSRWLLFFDAVIDIVSKGKEKAETIKKRFEDTLKQIEENKRTTISPSDKVKHYLELMQRLQDKYEKTGSLTQDEAENLKYANERYSVWKQKEGTIGLDIFTDNIKAIIKDSFRKFGSYLEDAAFILDGLNNAKNNLNQFLQIKSIAEIEKFQRVITAISKIVRIPTTPIEITPEEIEKDAEKYGLDAEKSKRAMETAKKELTVLIAGST